MALGQSKSRHLGVLQAGRGLAALAVVCFHLTLMMATPRYGNVMPFWSVTWLGGRGVDFFFVLSGFIMMYAHKADIGDKQKVSSFAYKRFERLFPVYWLYVTGFIVLVAIGFGQNSSLPQTLPGWLQTFVLVRLNEEAQPLAPAWTLFHEIAFYACFALLIGVPKVGKAVMAVWFIVCLAFFQMPGEDARTPFSVYTSLINLDFLFGMAAFRLFGSLTDVRWSWACLIGGAVGVAATILFIVMGPGGPVVSLMFGIAFALILAGAAALERLLDFSAPKALVVLGDASYTMYLVHIAIEGLVLKAMVRALPVVGPYVTYIGALAITVSLSVAVYFLCEKRVLGILRKMRRSSPADGAQALV